ncbi:MAG: peptide ABC transporter substrate-binding protein [Candidatus Rhabdochlamydia sp.]
MKYIGIFILIIASAFFFFPFIKPKNKLQVLRLNIRSEPKAMDPRKGGELLSAQMQFLFFEGLVKMYPDQSMKLAQAKSYEVSEDKLTYTFHLRDTVWSNNTPVTAYDFEQSWKDILDPKFPSAREQLLSAVKNAEAAKKGLISLDEVGIKAIDAKTLVITLEKPIPYLFKLLSFCAFSPINMENDRKNPNWAHDAGPNFLCNGPYSLEKWDHGNQIIAARNPNYRKTEDLHPEKIIFNIVENDVVTLEMFEKGLIDVIGDALTDIPLEAIPRLEKKWTISREPKACTLLININTEKPPFNHPKIRRAFSLAINRQELIGLSGKGVKKNILTEQINTAYQASCTATNLIPPCLKENRYHSFFIDNDIERARILLEEGLQELGLDKKVFESIALYYSQRSFETNALIQVIQQQWLKVLGIFIKLECLDFSIMLDKLFCGNYAMSFMRWNEAYPDPMSILERFKYKAYTMNFSNWEHPEYIQLLDRSFYEEGDKRMQTLEQAEKLLLSEMPVIPLYHEDYVYMINPRLPFTIPLWWKDRTLLPISAEDQRVQKENKYAQGAFP